MARHISTFLPEWRSFCRRLTSRAWLSRRCVALTYLQPGQTTTCIGCHEPRNTAPPQVRPLAALRQPSKITPGPPGTWPLDYETLVQDVLDRRCVECHQPGASGSNWDLRAGKSYEVLVGYGHPSLRDHVLRRYQEGRSTIGACAATVNPLWKLLDQGHYDVSLDSNERLRLISWMDTYGQRLGSFNSAQEDHLRQLKARMTSILRQ